MIYEDKVKVLLGWQCERDLFPVKFKIQFFNDSWCTLYKVKILKI